VSKSIWRTLWTAHERRHKSSSVTMTWITFNYPSKSRIGGFFIDLSSCPQLHRRVRFSTQRTEIAICTSTSHLPGNCTAISFRRNYIRAWSRRSRSHRGRGMETGPFEITLPCERYSWTLNVIISLISRNRTNSLCLRRKHFTNQKRHFWPTILRDTYDTSVWNAQSTLGAPIALLKILWCLKSKLSDLRSQEINMGFPRRYHVSF
jgi:hypothetical protein